MQTAQFELHAAIEDRHWWFVARRKIVRRLIDHVLGGCRADSNGNGKQHGRSHHPTALPKREGTKPDTRPLVIDIGCGTGANIASLADSYRCVGIDTSVDAIQWARQKFPDVQFINGFAPRTWASKSTKRG